MKLLSLGLFVASLTGSLMAQAVQIDVCYKDTGSNDQRIIGRITINNDNVSQSYMGLDGQDLGGMRGRSFTITAENGIVKVTKLTLNDRDGWIDDMNIEITATTVSTKIGSNRVEKHTVVPCPVRK